MNSRSPTLGMLLRRLIELLDGDLQIVYREAGLDYRPRYTPVVRALLELGPSPIRDIAGRARLTHSAASQTVAQMARDGLLASEAGADARERVISMTPKLKRMLAPLEAQWAATNRAADKLSDELPYSLQDLVSSAIDALEQKPFRDRIAEASGKSAGRRRRATSAGQGGARK